MLSIPQIDPVKGQHRHNGTLEWLPTWIKGYDEIEETLEH